LLRIVAAHAAPPQVNHPVVRSTTRFRRSSSSCIGASVISRGVRRSRHGSSGSRIGSPAKNGETPGVREALCPSRNALAESNPTPIERLEVAERLRRLDDALATLDDERRGVFILAEIEQMTAPEIAEALGINRNTVYSRLRLARRDLEVALAARPEESA
jgi:RNA polymerase sigma factor (sigma-70 family)